jgi:hypothetical protein
MAGGRGNCGADNSWHPDKCNCPIIGRDSAVVVPAVAAPHGPDQLRSAIATVPLTFIPRLAAAHFSDYREAGPPTDLLIRFERLLI